MIDVTTGLATQAVAIGDHPIGNSGSNGNTPSLRGHPPLAEGFPVESPEDGSSTGGRQPIYAVRQATTYRLPDPLKEEAVVMAASFSFTP